MVPAGRTPTSQKILKILVHVAAIVGLYLGFTTAMYLGLEADSPYDGIGIAVTVVAVTLYSNLDIIRK